MSSARKFLALALAACKSKQYEEAGIFLAQAAQADGSEELATELGANDDSIAITGLPKKPEETEDAAEEDAEEDVNAEDADTESEDGAEKSAAVAEPEEPRSIITAAEDDWGDDDTTDEVSVSSVTRRRSTSLSHVGKILAASMAVVSSDESDEEDDEDEDMESDPDFTGTGLIPASFSSVKVKSVVVKSPVKLRQ